MSCFWFAHSLVYVFFSFYAIFMLSKLLFANKSIFAKIKFCQAFSLTNCIKKWASTSSGCANNKGADQPAHLRRLISAFVIRSFESAYIISTLATCEIPIFLAEETGLSLPLSETPKRRRGPNVRFVYVFRHSCI